jgi:glycosyltransferase involved in cell wall biosynthesis
MNLVLAADTFGRAKRTGLDRYFHEIVRGMAARDVVMTYALGKGTGQGDGLPDGVRAVHRGASRRAVIARGLLGLEPPVEEWTGPADLVHALAPLPLRARAPLAVTVHDLTPLLTPEAFSPGMRLTFRRTLGALVRRGAWFITNSACTSADLQRTFGVAPERTFAVHLGVDGGFRPTPPEEHARVRARYDLPERFFLFTGSMNRRKNLPTLLRAFAQYAARGGTARLVVAGRMEWGGDEVRRAVRTHGVERAVVFPGYVEEGDLPAVIGAARALAYPSLYEGFGFPPLEAMACGTPVVASDVPALVETTGGHALLVPPLDADRLAAALAALDTDDALRARLVAGGQAWAAAFRWERTVEQTRAAYAEILRHPVR